MKKKQSKLIIILIIIVVLIILCALLLIKVNSKAHNGLVDLYSEDVESFQIETSDIILEFPKKWEAITEVKMNKTSDSETIEFWADFDSGNQAHLFDININGEGYNVGSYTKENGDVNEISVVSYDINDGLSDKEMEQAYQMSEDVNYILMKLNDVDGYEEKK